MAFITNDIKKNILIQYYSFLTAVRQYTNPRMLSKVFFMNGYRSPNFYVSGDPGDVKYLYIPESNNDILLAVRSGNIIIGEKKSSKDIVEEVYPNIFADIEDFISIRETISDDKTLALYLVVKTYLTPLVSYDGELYESWKASYGYEDLKTAIKSGLFKLDIPELENVFLELKEIYAKEDAIDDNRTPDTPLPDEPIPDDPEDAWDGEKGDE